MTVAGSEAFSMRGKFSSSTQGTGSASGGSRQSELEFNFAGFMIPHPEKAHKGGEDAMFSNKYVLSVADGVGGWAEYGVDPGLYSKELCRNIEKFYNSNPALYSGNPKQLIIDAAGTCKEIGTSTCVIVVLDNAEPILRASYIGDSGYYIFRPSPQNALQLIHESKEQTKAFNFPYQIGTDGDSPNLSLTFNHQIQSKDIVIVGTDGLIDNMETKSLQGLVEKHLNNEGTLNDPNSLAKEIAEKTFKQSIDKTFDSPFAQNARKAGYQFRGGKSDDITVVVGQVKRIKISK